MFFIPGGSKLPVYMGPLYVILGDDEYRLLPEKSITNLRPRADSERNLTILTKSFKKKHIFENI